MAQRPDERPAAGGLIIRAASAGDHDAIWKIFQATIATGDTFVFDASMSRESALAYWCAADAATFVAEHDGNVIGSYLLRPNQPGLGNHVANAGYMVDLSARGLGVGRAMAEHSLEEARRGGYRAMQFNFVVSTNESAVHLWRQLGFHIAGTLPGVFRHAQKGFVDAYVMFRALDD
ncbi:MAG TPA: GNAT family N-acetyltransferase [Chthoniobacterales bacterium]|nr:GNAT family N-acetyltransferase [Chthoniobacterales bacterium]